MMSSWARAMAMETENITQKASRKQNQQDAVLEWTQGERDGLEAGPGFLTGGATGMAVPLGEEGNFGKRLTLRQGRVRGREDGRPGG